jgi:hypothetical protein
LEFFGLTIALSPVNEIIKKKILIKIVIWDNICIFKNITKLLTFLKSFPMKTTTFYLVLCLVTVALISSCGKDYPDPASACCTCLKEKTTTGRGTMSMKIGNHIWSNCNVKNENYRSVGVYWDPIYNKFDIEGSQYYSNEAAEKFYINVRRPFLGDYIESNKYKYLFRLFYQGTYNGWAEYAMDITHSSSMYTSLMRKKGLSVGHLSAG